MASGQQPSIALLERCVMRAERSADVPALRLLMGRLDLLNYKIVGAAAKVRFWRCRQRAWSKGWQPVRHGCCLEMGLSAQALLQCKRCGSLSTSQPHPEVTPESLQLRRWDEEGGMPVLVGTERFVSRPMSGGYRHPDIIRCARACWQAHVHMWHGITHHHAAPTQGAWSSMCRMCTACSVLCHAICRPPAQQQHSAGFDQQDGDLEPDIAHEDWGTAARPPPLQPPVRADAAAQM